MKQPTTDPKPAAQAMTRLINQLGSRNDALREQAEGAFRQMGSDEVAQLVRLVRAEPNKTMRRMGLWFAVVAWPMVMLPAWASFGMGSSVLPLLRWLTFGLFLVGYVTLFPLLVARPRFQSNLRRSLTLVNDVQALGPLILYYGRPEGFPTLFGQQRLIKDSDEALRRLLSSIQSDDDIDITSAERRSLRIALSHSNPDRVQGLLQLLVHIGDSQDLTLVRKLEAGSWSARKNPAVREAAMACRVAIEARLADQAITGTLLRASSPSVIAETLLRPVLATQPTEQTQLLRATRQDDTTAT